MKKLLLASVVILLSWNAYAEEQQIILYKNDQVPLNGNPNTNWEAYSNAYSSGTYPLRFDRWKNQGKIAVEVLLQIVFKSTDSLANTGVAIDACGALPNAPYLDGATCTNLAFFAANTNGSASYTPTLNYWPHVDGLDSSPPNSYTVVYSGGGPHPYWYINTDGFNALIQQGTPLFANILTFGDGANGPLVYDAELIITWK